VSADIAYTGLSGSDADGAEYKGAWGSVISAALLLPGRWGVFSGSSTVVLGVPGDMPIRDTTGLRASFAKDISDSFYVGASLFAGFSWKFDNFALAGDLGAFLRLGQIGFLRDARLGMVLANLGATFKAVYPDDGYGIKGVSEAGYVPGIFTPRGGFAATLFETQAFRAGFSTDIAFPSFQNLLWNIGLQASIGGLVTISAGWDVNVAEAVELNKNGKSGLHSPYVGLGVKLVMNTGENEFMKSRGWQQSDLAISAVAQQLHEGFEGNLFLVSAGATANFGQRDTSPPVIELWNGEGGSK